LFSALNETGARGMVEKFKDHTPGTVLVAEYGEQTAMADTLEEANQWWNDTIVKMS